MKFENIKVGDTVFVEREIRYGWGNMKDFWIPTKVKRVTKTQFVVEFNDRRFKKERGQEIGCDSYGKYAKNEGDVYGFGAKCKVYDQTKEMNAFVEKINLLRHVNSMINSVSTLNAEMSIEGLQRAEEILNELKDLK